MASLKAEKAVGTQLFGQAKKEPAKTSDGASKGSGSKSATKKSAAKTQEAAPKKKGKGGKSAAKH